MSDTIHELPPVDYTQVDFDQMPTDFPQSGAESEGYAPYSVGIEGQEFGQDPVALSEAGPSIASRVGDRLAQVGGTVREAAGAVSDKLQDPRFRETAWAVGQGALIGAGLANRESDGSISIDTAGVATTVRKVVKSPIPLGLTKIGAQAAWGAYKEFQAVKTARGNVNEAYDTTT